MAEDDESESSLLGRRRGFARDVAVNLLANLAAAAIIYLVGVALGLFPGDAMIVFLAIVIVLIATGGGIAALITVHIWIEKRSAALATLSMAIFAYGVGIVGITNITGKIGQHDWFNATGFLVCSVLGLAWGTSLVVRTVRTWLSHGWSPEDPLPSDDRHVTPMRRPFGGHMHWYSPTD
jgi:hypothetical protein